MVVIIFLLYAIFGCLPVMGRGIIEPESRSDGEIDLQFPMKIEQGNGIGKFLVVLNASFVKNKILTMEVPTGDGKSHCTTKFHFKEQDDSLVKVFVDSSDSLLNLDPYKLFKTTTFELWIEIIAPELLVYIQGHGDTQHAADRCSITDIENINYIRLNGGFSYINSIRFEYENSI